jgi:hypothetical protein
VKGLAEIPDSTSAAVGQPAALFRTNFEPNQAIAACEDALRLATGTLREGIRSQLLGTFAVIAITG